jgi:hypothetical protein
MKKQSGGGIVGRVLVAACLLLALAVPVLAQGTAVIEGTVKDESGAVIKGATVRSTNVATGWATEATTSPVGTYRLDALPPGVYRITVDASDFPRLTREGVTVHVGQAVAINHVLKVGQFQEALSVTAEAPLVNATKSEIGQIVESERIQELPLNGRDFLELAELAPGVAPSTGFGGGLTSINGLSFRNVTIHFDGLEVTDVVDRGAYGYYTSEPVQEFQVITNRFTAEYGRSMSGVINVVTKSGTNDFHGTAYIYGRDQRLNARQWVFNSDTLGLDKEKDKSPFSQKQYGASLGGPIVKDKTHFFVNYERDAYHTTTIVSADPAWSIPALDISKEVGNFPQNNDGDHFFAKLDHQLSTKHSLEASFTRKTETDTNVYVGGFSTQAFGAQTVYDEKLFMLSDRLALSNRTLNEFRFQIGTRQNDWNPNSRHPSVYEYTDFGVITCCGSHPSVDQTNHTRRLEFKDDLTLHLSQHSLKFGGDFQVLRGDSDTRYTATGYYVVYYGSPLYLRQAFGPTHFVFDENVDGVYAQDDWRVRDNLMLNLGLRYEYNQFAPSDHGDIAPRAGFAYDPWKDGKTSVRGGTGLFYDMAFTQLLQVSAWGGPNGAYTLTFRPSDPLYPSNFGSISSLPPGRPIPARDIYELDPNMKTARSWQSSIGIQREIARDLAISVDAVYVRGHNLFRIRDLNAPPFEGPYPKGQETTFANALRPTPPVPNGFRRIDQLESSGSSEYEGLYFNLTRRVRGGHTFQLSYTLAKSRDNLGYGGDYVSRPNDSTNMAAEWGPSLNDLRHTLAANGTVQLPWGFSVGGIFLAYSGRPYTAQLGYDYNGDGVINDRPPGVGKDTLTGDWFRELDLFLNKAFKFKERYQLIVRLEAFNVFDTLNKNNYGNIVGTNTYLIATGAFPPRQLQVSARFAF